VLKSRHDHLHVLTPNDDFSYDACVCHCIVLPSQALSNATPQAKAAAKPSGPKPFQPAGKAKPAPSLQNTLAPRTPLIKPKPSGAPASG